MMTNKIEKENNRSTLNKYTHCVPSTHWRSQSHWMLLSHSFLLLINTRLFIDSWVHFLHHHQLSQRIRYFARFQKNRLSNEKPCTVFTMHFIYRYIYYNNSVCLAWFAVYHERYTFILNNKISFVGGYSHLAFIFLFKHFINIYCSRCGFRERPTRIYHKQIAFSAS